MVLCDFHTKRERMTLFSFDLDFILKVKVWRDWFLSCRMNICLNLIHVHNKLDVAGAIFKNLRYPFT